VRAAVASCAAFALVACTASPEQAALRCEREVRSASTSTSVSGEFAMGYASDRGFVSDSDIALSAGVDLGSGRDPRAAYEDCVRARTGQGPVRPYGAS
jgi:hypothetical protein